MKLNFLFLLMELLTLLAYPIVFAHGKLRQYLKPKEGFHLVNVSMIVLVTPER